MKRFAPIIDNGTGIIKAAFAVSAIRCFSERIHKTARFSQPYPCRVLNMATGAFLRSDCDEMIVIDTDIEFEPHDLDMLLSHDLPLVFGRYPKKTLPLEWCLETLTEADPFGGEEPLVEVARVGRGFMRVHRDVFDKTFPNAANYSYGDRDEKEYWKEGCVNGEWLSEDWLFCDSWRAIGNKVLVDQRIKLRHHGDYGFRAN